MKSSLDEMVRGYLAGLDACGMELPASQAHENAAFRHGWINGRNDRLGTVKESADVLRRRAGMILGEY